METQILNQGTETLSNSTTGAESNWTGGLLQAHEAISGWEVIEKISALTGEADIYLVQKNGKKGVVKYYRSTVKPKTEILKKLKGLHHPDIVKIYEFGDYYDRFYEIMEYAEGGALDSRKEDGTYKYLPLTEEQTVQVCKEIISSYKTCHENGIIHRDIKPGNLFYRNADGSDVIIGDFGISSIMDDLAKLHKTQTASRTTGYAAPEVLSGMISGKMDYYALGITLWELLTGKDPFTLENGKRRNDAHLIRDTIEGRMADDMLSREPRLSPSMQRLIRGLLVIDPDHRWGYDEVSRHLAGKEVPVYQQKKKELSFKIGEKVCVSLEEIGTTLLENPEGAQRYVFRGLLGGYLEADYPGMAEKITGIVDVSSTDGDYYSGIMKIAYLLNPAIPFKVGNGFSVFNIEDIVFLLENAPETMLPLLTNAASRLYTYIEILGYEEQAKKIRALPDTCSDIERIGKALVILKNYTIKPFKLVRYAGFQLSELEQILHVPKDMQAHILNLISTQSYEGNFLPWLDLAAPDVGIEKMKTDSWEDFLGSIPLASRA